MKTKWEAPIVLSLTYEQVCVLVNILGRKSGKDPYYNDMYFKVLMQTTHQGAVLEALRRTLGVQPAEPDTQEGVHEDT
jgi:hypothetical protein